MYLFHYTLSPVNSYEQLQVRKYGKLPYEKRSTLYLKVGEHGF